MAELDLDAIRERAKGPLHEALHALNPRIPNLDVGDCHCNLLAEVALDALMPILGELPSLTTERDRLRAQLDAARGVLATARQRDAAQALLVAEQRDHAATRDKLTDEIKFWKDQQKFAAKVAGDIADLDEQSPALRQMLRTERARRKAVEAESVQQAYMLERQRPVIEAVEVWQDVARDLFPYEDEDTQTRRVTYAERDLFAAWDALGAPTPSRTWSLPPEPGLDVTRVLDAYGQYFERQHDEHPGDDVWIGQTFAGDGDVPDLELEWPMLMAYQSPLTDATPTCTCGNSPMTYEGPEPDCPVHGAVRAYNQAAAELERQRPVIEAARAWRGTDDGHAGLILPPSIDQINALIAAVDALGTPTPSEEGGSDG
jgi:hypothetical protein